MAWIALVLPPGPAAAAPRAAADSTFRMPFRLVDNRVFVDVTLNGEGPFHFILDTGADGVVSDHVAQRLGLKVADAGEDQGVGAAKQRFGATRVARLRVGALELTDLPMAVTSLDTPDVFGRQAVDGVIGSEVFERRVVTQDYVHRTLTFRAPTQFRAPPRAIVLPITRPQQIPVVHASLDGIAGDFGVDTGARSALLLYGPFCADHRLAEKYHATLEGVTGWGIGGPVRSLLARAQVLDLGGVSVHGPIVRLSTQKAGATTSSAMAGLIGPDVLGQFDVTFDYARMRILLVQNAAYGRADAYDRAGVWMGQEGDRFRAVDVIPGGPADAAGLHAGDTILAIDGVSTRRLDLPAVRERMRRRAVGTRVTLRVASHGVERDVVLTLRDLA